MQKLIETKEGYILEDKICPFRNPLVLPSQTIAGQLTIQNIPCTSACALFDVVQLTDNYIHLKCGVNSTIRVELVKAQPEPKSNLTIIT